MRYSGWWRASILEGLTHIPMNNLYHPKNSHEHRKHQTNLPKSSPWNLENNWNSSICISIYPETPKKVPQTFGTLKTSSILLGCSQFQVGVPETNKSPNKNSPQPLLLLLLVPNPLCNQGQHLPMPRAWNHHIADSFKCNSNSNISWCFDLKDLPQNFVLCKPVVLRSKEIFASQLASTIFWTPAWPPWIHILILWSLNVACGLLSYKIYDAGFWHIVCPKVNDLFAQRYIMYILGLGWRNYEISKIKVT